MNKLICTIAAVLTIAGPLAPLALADDGDQSDAPPVTLDRSSWG